jgi:DNA polymerase elongation subunit (family B)
MEHECLAPVSILVEKKKYVMAQIYKEGTWYLDKPKMKIKGIEVVRSSTPKVARDKLKRMLELIFETDDNDTLIAFAESFRKEFFKLPFEMVASPRGVSKLDKYNFQSKSIPIQVRASMVFNKALKAYNLQDKYQTITNGSKIKFCYLKVPNWLGSNIIGVVNKLPPELIDKFEIDYTLQFEKAFINPLKKIFSSLNWYFEKEANADGFFEED